MGSLLDFLLIGALLAATASFVAVGASHARRRRRLARGANNQGMRFSPEDLFDVPRRYGEFALIRAGHSFTAANVAHGRVDGWSVRSFDFRYEIGRGAGRMTRRYWVIIVEAQSQMPHLTIWNDLDKELAPLEATTGAVHSAPWWRSGDQRRTDTVAQACAALSGEGVSIQTRGKLLMLCAPVLRKAADTAAYYSTAVRAAAVLAQPPQNAGPAIDSHDGRKDVTEP